VDEFPDAIAIISKLAAASRRAACAISEEEDMRKMSVRYILFSSATSFDSIPPLSSLPLGGLSSVCMNLIGYDR